VKTNVATACKIGLSVRFADWEKRVETLMSAGNISSKKKHPQGGGRLLRTFAPLHLVGEIMDINE